MPCPQDIDVPRIFELYNDTILYNDIKTAQSLYRGEQHRADNCTECRACENACAKRLAMLEWLKKAHRLLAESE
jgi:predicted aldo/keto reductase-like oxidoreductase